MKRLLTFALVASFATMGYAADKPPPKLLSHEAKPEHVEKSNAQVPAKATYPVKKKHNVLVWSRAAGFVHSSIPIGGHTMIEMGKKTGVFDTTETIDLAMFEPENLKKFDGIILNNTTGFWLKPMPDKYPGDAKLVEKYGSADKAADALLASLLDFVGNGGALIGYHSATDANGQRRPFVELIGGLFDQHPWHEKVTIKIEEPNHPLMKAFGGQSELVITDEIYQFGKEYNRDDRRVLMSLDTSKTNMDKKNIKRTDGDFGVSWIRTHGKGRVFYCSLGHREEIFWNPIVMQYYLDGIQWALHDTDVPADPRSLAKAGAKGDPNCATCNGDAAACKLDSLDCWTYKPDGWKVEDGALALQDKGGYLWSKQQYGDFELNLEFKVSKGCNSGLFFRSNPKDPVQGGFEIQIFDSYGKTAGKHDCGALYDTYPPLVNAVKPAGEWNTLKLIAKGPKITTVINGQTSVDLNIDDWKEGGKNPDGSPNKFKTALKDLPRVGHIGFQDHGHPVWYRNITIKPLK
jgi:type 1 glutamine amidotransferase